MTYKICEWDSEKNEQVERDATPEEAADIDARKNAPMAVPQSVTALQALLAIDAMGIAGIYELWANSEERTFAERAFIDKATVWNRDNAILIAGAEALGLTSDQIDQLFISAAGIV